MKSPDEIKKDLEDAHKSCYLAIELGDPLGYPTAVYASYEATGNGLSLIQQLEFQNGELLKTVEMLKAEIEEYEESAGKCCYESKCNAELNKLEALCKRLMDENEQLEVERDAAVAELANSDSPCDFCKYLKKFAHETPCNNCVHVLHGEESQFKWRGVQKEE